MKHCVLVKFITAYGQPKTYVLTAGFDRVDVLQRSVIETLLWCNKENKTAEIHNYQADEARQPLMEPTLNGAFSVEILPLQEMFID
jgi:hypothetical protein